jgi:hypothetical protein
MLIDSSRGSMLEIKIAGKKGEGKWSVLAAVNRSLQRNSMAKKVKLVDFYMHKKNVHRHMWL